MPRAIRDCPNVDELRRLAESGEHSIEVLRKRYDVGYKTFVRWLSVYGIPRPRPRVQSLPGETWKPVVGWEGLYEVSSMGRVKSLERVTDNYHTSEKLRRLIPHRRELAYLQVHLFRGGRNGERFQPYVHTLVLEAFIGPRPEGMQACHNNGNHHDNRLENLRWDTPANNSMDRIIHGTQSRVIPIELAKKIVELSETNTRAERKQIAKELGCPTKYVWRVLCGPNFRYLRDGIIG